jgi:hypothetical protein
LTPKENSGFVMKIVNERDLDNSQFFSYINPFLEPSSSHTHFTFVFLKRHGGSRRERIHLEIISYTMKYPLWENFNESAFTRMDLV